MAKTVRYYDPATKTVANIPEREKSDRTIQGRVEGVEGEVHFDHHLPDALVDRIKKVAAVFAEVDPIPLEQWVYDFSLDQTPEREVIVYEKMAEVYTGLVQPSYSLGRKKDVYAAVLGCTMFPLGIIPRTKWMEMICMGRKYLVLKKREVEKVCDAWSKACTDRR